MEVESEQKTNMSLTTSLLTAGVNSHQETAETFNALATDFVTAGVAGTIALSNGTTSGTGSFAINAHGTPNMTVDISAGTAWLFATPSSQSSQALRVKNSATASVVIASNSSGSTKYDFVYISISAASAAAPAVNADDVATLTTSRSSSSTTDNGTPPTYGLLLGVVTVANGAASITQGNVSDRRSNAVLSSAGVSQATSWNSLGLTPNTVTALGNRSYSMVFNSTDLSGTLSAGMRLRATRTVAAPTQCTSLNGTTQYYSKTSPAGMTFTDDFVVSAWVKLSSYAAGVIASRYNGTSGWVFEVLSTGQLSLGGLNAGSANFSNLTTYQSIPLNKWVHVSAQLDMSTFTATTTTSYAMIDGVDVPVSVARSGTNPTALIQAGNLEIGSTNAGTKFFPGKIAQVAIYSAKVTQATILASMNQSLAGTETSLISAYSFNGVITDLNTTNANNLTANGSAVATSADSPFGGQADGTISSTLDYAIVQKVAFSTNTTVTVQVPEGCTIPTSGGVSSVVYSPNAAPYGFPKQSGKWSITWLLKASTYFLLGATNNTWQSGPTNGNFAITMPLGEWRGGLDLARYADRGASVTIELYSSLSTSNSSESDVSWTIGTKSPIASGTAYHGAIHTKTGDLSVSTATPYYILGKAASGDGTIGNNGLNTWAGSSNVTFWNAYL